MRGMGQPSADPAIIDTLRSRWEDFTRLLNAWSPDTERGRGVKEECGKVVGKVKGKVGELLVRGGK